jgi:glutathione S-transferase
VIDELYQTEWCPASRRVRQRLTELGVDVVLRQVPAEREARDALMARTGADTVPALVTAEGAVLVGADAILAHLDPIPEPLTAGGHRAMAERARRRYLQEECT